MKGVLFLGLVGAAIYGAILLSYDLLPHDPAANVFTGQNLGNPEDRQLRSWGTDLPALASSSSSVAPLARGCSDASIAFPCRRLRRHSIPVSRMGQGCLRREGA